MSLSVRVALPLDVIELEASLPKPAFQKGSIPLVFTSSRAGHLGPEDIRETRVSKINGARNDLSPIVISPETMASAAFGISE